jgi:hypothetical protein
MSSLLCKLKKFKSKRFNMERLFFLFSPSENVQFMPFHELPRSMLHRLLNVYITDEAKSNEIDRVFAGQTSRLPS